MLLPLLRGANAAANQCQANDVMESVTSHRMTTTVCIGLVGRRMFAAFILLRNLPTIAPFQQLPSR